MTRESPAEFSLAYLTVLGTPPRRMIEIAAATGYDYVSLRLLPVTDDEPSFPFTTDPVFVRDVVKSLSDNDMSVLDVELIRADPGFDVSEFKAFVEVSAELGARHIVTQIPEAELAVAAEQFRAICELAAPLELTVDLEFIPWSATASLDVASAIVTEADMPNGAILVDTLHFDRSSSSVAQLENLERNMFNFAQLCDARGPSSVDRHELIRVARFDREPPGDGDIDLLPVLEAMPVVPYALEVPNEARRQELGSVEFSRLVLDKARSFLDGSGAKEAVAAG